VSPTLSLIVAALASAVTANLHAEYLSGDSDDLRHRPQQEHPSEYIKPYRTGLELSWNVSDRRIPNLTNRHLRRLFLGLPSNTRESGHQ
jgi:hypothetical protein